MSAIDSYNHAHVGNFCGIPIYWLLENVEMSELTDNANDDEYFLTKFNLVLGGGSGEHRALVLDNDALILNLLRNIGDEVNAMTFNEVDYQLYELTDSITDRYLKEHKYYYRFNTNEWPLDSFMKVNEEINLKYREKYSSHTDNRCLEDKIMDDIALFIIYNMPLDYCLEDPQLIEAAKIIRSNEWKEVFTIGDIAMYSLGAKKTIGASLGKIIKNNEVIWGYSLDDWIQDNRPIELSNKLNKELLPKEKHSKLKI